MNCKSAFRVLLALSSAAIAVTSTAAAFAAEDQPQPPPAFGSRGVLAIGTDAALGVEGTSSGGVSTTNVLVQPAAHYFVARNLSIGVELRFEYETQSTPAAHTIEGGIGPTVGYNIPLSSAFSLWPRASVWASEESIDSLGAQSSRADLWVNGDLRILYHPAPHFFVGFGPYVQQLLTGSDKTTLYGASFTIGGWVGP
jgi:hypothetical protein